MIVDKKSIVAPDLTYKPGGAIALGNIIADPFKPNEILSTLDPTAPQPMTRKFITRELTMWRTIRSRPSMRAKIRRSLGLKAPEHRTLIDVNITLKNIVTTKFVKYPLGRDVWRRIQEPKVRDAMKLTQICSQPVYIITAIKVCNNVSVKFIRTDWISGHPNGIQMPVRDIGDNELSVFPSSGHFHSKEGIVCAYQVSKIVPEGRRSKTKVVRLKPFPPRGFVVEEDWAPVLLNSFHMHQWEWNNIDLRDWSPVSGMA